jgi:mono/diheme cytochrome c family protein
MRRRKTDTYKEHRMPLSRPTLRLLAALVLSPAAVQAQTLDELDGGITADPNSASAAARGKYVLFASGCIACHTAQEEGATPLVGGHVLETDFGTFNVPNITPDPETGIGNWSLEDFRRAVREGIAPDGSYYYPAFPFTSYVGMTDRDVEDLFTYLQSVRPVRNARVDHDLKFPYNIRAALGPWRWLYFDPDEAGRDREARAQDRGAYLVNTLGHCGECHSPRGWLGAVDADAPLAGSPIAPPINQRALANWSRADMLALLESGFTPESDVVGGSMTDVIEDNTSQLTDADRGAIADYLLGRR